MPWSAARYFGREGVEEVGPSRARGHVPVEEQRTCGREILRGEDDFVRTTTSCSLGGKINSSTLLTAPPPAVRARVLPAVGDLFVYVPETAGQGSHRGYRVATSGRSARPCSQRRGRSVLLSLRVEVAEGFSIVVALA